MAAEYKLSYTATEIDEKLGKIDNLVATINGVSPDENGNVEIKVSGGNVENGGGKTYHVTSLTTTEEVSEISIPLQNYEDTELFLYVCTGSTIKYKWGIIFPALKFGNIYDKYVNYGSAVPESSQYATTRYFRIMTKHADNAYQRHILTMLKNQITTWSGPYYLLDAEPTFNLYADTQGETFPIGTEVHLVEVFNQQEVMA